jgi:hypothetical protein
MARDDRGGFALLAIVYLHAELRMLLGRKLISRTWDRQVGRWGLPVGHWRGDDTSEPSGLRMV